MSLPSDYNERVYAGWLGKCIGVRFGAPLENWTYEDIADNLGELKGYLREDQGKIFKPDDDTAVPMILVRAIEDYGPDASAGDMGETLLDYLGDQHGTFWWGGYGVSTEHTAYLNMAASFLKAPQSGSIAQNGAAIAEQIGGQIFSDIWGWLAPDDPTRAADLAAKASSVTHDGNGIYGGRFIAALVSAAFSERDPRKLIDIGLAQIPADSEYARVINAMVEYHAQNPDDWRAAYAYLKANFGYDRYPGIVHIIPNAGIVALGLLYGSGDFSRSIQIANMGGWDTDCNVGNVGAIMATALGLDAIDASWREPINDVIILSSIIGTRNLMTIPQCADLFCALGRKIQGEASEARPRYHFDYRGSINNFSARGDKGRPIHQQQSQVGDVRTLQTAVRKLNKKGEVRVFTRTYYRPKELSGNYYEACFTPLIAPGQTITARVYLPETAPDTITASLYIHDDNHNDDHQTTGEALTPGAWHTLTFQVPALKDTCLSEVGIVLRNLGELWETGSFHIASLDWSGAPDYETTFAKERAESGGVSQWTRLRGYWRLENGGYHGGGPGECETYTGDTRWTNYIVEAELVPLAGEYHHINARVQGAQKSYAFGLRPYGRIALYKKNKVYNLVAHADFAWEYGIPYRLKLIVSSADTFKATITATDGNSQTLTWQDTNAPYLNGQIGLSTWYGGHMRCNWLRVRPHGG